MEYVAISHVTTTKRVLCGGLYSNYYDVTKERTQSMLLVIAAYDVIVQIPQKYATSDKTLSFTSVSQFFSVFLCEKSWVGYREACLGLI